MISVSGRSLPQIIVCHPSAADGWRGLPFSDLIHGKPYNQWPGGLMPISELLLSEFDEEMKKTHTMLERVPEDKKDFAPHPKSMPLNRLAPHVAELAGFGLTILTTPELDFANSGMKPLPFESAAQLVS